MCGFCDPDEPDLPDPWEQADYWHEMHKEQEVLNEQGTDGS